MCPNKKCLKIHVQLSLRDINLNVKLPRNVNIKNIVQKFYIFQCIFLGIYPIKTIFLSNQQKYFFLISEIS